MVDSFFLFFVPMIVNNGQLLKERYRVIQEIGIGGMGIVYLIVDEHDQQKKALKILKPDLARYDLIRQRFSREAKIQSTLHHPNITKVYQLIEVQGLPAIIMEFLEGWNLADWIDAGNQMSPEMVRSFSIQIASALELAHQAGAVHRDLKPENIFLLSTRDQTLLPKMLDFGVAKIFDAAPLTVTNAFVGTYRYASPEQIIRATEVDFRSDLYSLGVLMWELLAHKQPWASLYGTYAVQKAVIQRTLPSLPDSVPVDLATIVRKLLFKEPELRFQTAFSVKDALFGEYDEQKDQKIGESRNHPPGYLCASEECISNWKNSVEQPEPEPILLTQRKVSQSEPTENYALLVRESQEEFDLRTSTNTYETVASNRRAFVLFGILLFLIGGIALNYAIKSQDHPLEISEIFRFLDPEK